MELYSHSINDIITTRFDVDVYNNLTPHPFLVMLAWLPLHVLYCLQMTILEGYGVAYLRIKRECLISLFTPYTDFISYIILNSIHQNIRIRL